MDFPPNNPVTPPDGMANPIPEAPPAPVPEPPPLATPPVQEIVQPSYIVPLEMPKDSFGTLLQKYRVDIAELSLAEASAKAHVQLGTLRKLETGDFTQIDINPCYCQPLIQQLCDAYQLDPSETDNVMKTFEENWQKYAISSDALHKQNTLAKNLENSTPKSGQSLSAILISILSLFLVALIIGGYFYRTCQKNRLKGLDTDFDLPSIIEPQRLPLDVIPVPNS